MNFRLGSCGGSRLLRFRCKLPYHAEKGSVTPDIVGSHTIIVVLTAIELICSLIRKFCEPGGLIHLGLQSGKV